MSNAETDKRCLNEMRKAGWPVKETKSAVKIYEGKRKWQALPLVLLEPLADLMEKAIASGKYKKFSCLGECKTADADFYAAQIRHIEACQIDPLAIDEETGCYHSAQVAFNALMRLYHCRRNKE